MKNIKEPQNASKFITKLSLPSWMMTPEKADDWKDRLRQRKSKLKFSIEAVLKNAQENERREIEHGRVKWELLRENIIFRSDFNKWVIKTRKLMDTASVSSVRFDKINDEFCNKWKIKHPDRLFPELSFEEHAYHYWGILVGLMNTTFRFHEGDGTKNIKPTDKELFNLACLHISRLVVARFFGKLTPQPPIYNFSPDISSITLKGACDLSISGLIISEEFKETGIAGITVDFTSSKTELVKQFKVLIDELQPYIFKTTLKERKLQKPRKNFNYDDIHKYIESYRIKKTENLTNRELAKRLIPNDFDTDPRSAEEKIRQQYKEAERLIKKAADF